MEKEQGIFRGIAQRNFRFNPSSYRSYYWQVRYLLLKNPSYKACIVLIAHVVYH